MIRKFSSLLLTVLLLAALTPAAFASEPVTYALYAPEMSIALPSDLVVFEKIVMASDPNLAKYNLTKEDITEYMTSLNDRLYAFDDGSTLDIDISLEASTERDLNNFSDSELSDLKASLPSYFEENGYRFIKSEIYKTIGTTFLKVYCSFPFKDTELYVLQYFTFYDDYNISLALASFTGEITPDNEALIKGIADSVRLGGDAAAATVAASSGSNTDSADTWWGGSGVGGFSVGEIVLSLIIAAAVCSLPIIIYRYIAGRRRLSGKNPAK